MEKYKRCRLCLAKTIVSYSLMENNGTVILESLTSIKIKEKDGFSKRVCIKCWLNIKLAYKIQQNIIAVDKKLRSINFNEELIDSKENKIKESAVNETNENEKESVEANMENENGVNETVEDNNEESVDDPFGVTEYVQDFIKDEHFEMEEKFKPLLDEDEPDFDELDAGVNPNINDSSVVENDIDENYYENTDIREGITKYDSIHIQNKTENEVLIISISKDNEDIKQTVEETLEYVGDCNSSCQICGTSMEENVLFDHVKTHYFTRLKCEDCETYCENITAYRVHVMKHHKDMQKNWTCNLCLASFQYKPLYKIHTEKAHVQQDSETRLRNLHLSAKRSEIGRVFTAEYKYDCPHCPRKFRSEEKSLIHLKSHSKKECPICHLKITPSNYKVHFNTHSSIPVVCHFCGETYKNPTSLRSHIHYTHSTRKYQCQHCEKIYKKSYDLLLHTKKEHTGEKNHVCDICGKSFFAFYNLNKHKKMTHMKQRPHQCQYCKKRFSSKYSLKTHVRQHTNCTPYVCDICGEGFRQNVSLRAHRKSKHNIIEEKTIECKVCHRKFGTQWAVMSHMRLH